MLILAYLEDWKLENIETIAFTRTTCVGGTETDSDSVTDFESDTESVAPPRFSISKHKCLHRLYLFQKVKRS